MPLWYKICLIKTVLKGVMKVDLKSMCRTMESMVEAVFLSREVLRYSFILAFNMRKDITKRWEPSIKSLLQPFTWDINVCGAEICSTVAFIVLCPRFMDQMQVHLCAVVEQLSFLLAQFPGFRQVLCFQQGLCSSCCTIIDCPPVSFFPSCGNAQSIQPLWWAYMIRWGVELQTSGTLWS